MISYPYIEDYLEIIAGKKHLPGAVPVNSFWSTYAPIINLARYDNSFLDNVTDQTMNGSALTDRQAELAVKLITKYRRQLNAQNIEVPDMIVPRYRRALRIVDRTRSAGIVNGQVYLKFPYDTKVIDTIRSMTKQSQGFMTFDKDSKTWKLALTEFNVNWVYEYAKQNDFTIDSAMSELMQKIIECEQQDYSISLCTTEQGLTITNAHENLLNHVKQQVGLLEDSNLLKLVDAACVYGYNVDILIQEHIKDLVSGSVTLCMLNREYDFNNADDVEQRVVDYARVVNRWPVVVFNPTATSTEQNWTKHFDPEQVLVINNKKDIDSVGNVQLIYTNRPLKNLKSIPLLVSYAGMMIGTEKQVMLGAAQKVFYTAKKLK